MQFLNNVNLNLNQLLNSLMQLLGSDPGSPVEGQFWYNTAVRRPRWQSNSATNDIYPSASAATAGTNVLRDGSGNAALNVLTVASATITGTPSASTDAATVGYLQNYINGLSPKGTAALATAAALPANTYSNGTAGVGATLTGNANGALSIDGVAVQVGQTVLVMNEAAQANNGYYTVTATGGVSAVYVLTRTTNFDQAADVTGAFVFIGPGGTANADTGWIVNSTGPYTMGTTAITFAQFTGLGDVSVSAPLTKSGNNISATLSARIVNTSSAFDLASGVATPGTYNNVTVDTYGRVTAGSNAAYPKMYTGTITGDGSTTSFTVTHNLANSNPILGVRDSSHVQVMVDNTGATSNTLTLVFSVAPANAVVYNVTVIG